MNVALMPSVSVSVDAASIQKAVSLALVNTSRSMELLLADTAFYTAVKAQAYTPYTELSTIEEEMEVKVSPGKLKSGKLSTAKRRQRETLTQNTDLFEMNFAMWLVLARMNPNSKYNIATGGRWALQNPHLKGADRMAFLEAKAASMEKSRFSSTHFLQAGWKPIFKKIKALGLRGLGRLKEPVGTDVNNSLNTMSSDKTMELGDISRGGMGTALQYFTIENDVGLSGSSAKLNDEHNAALLAHGGAALQYAVDKQAEEMRDWNLEKDIGEDMRRQWESVPDASPFVPSSRSNPFRAAEVQSVNAEMEAAA